MNVHRPVQDFDRAREAMVDSQLRPAGVNDPAVIAAMAAVERERFVPEAARALAYAEVAVPLGDGRGLAPATALGLLLTQLAPATGERALIVGAATGYSAAVLAAMHVEVVALESDPRLAAAARENGAALVVEGPLDAGWKKAAPYDLLLIDGAVERLPDALLDQLADGGRFGAALVEKGVSRLIVGHKTAGGVGHYSIADWQMPRLPGFARQKTFTF